jgi:hypothetical protein
MAICNFTYQLTISPTELLQEITKLVDEFKGDFRGDEQNGTFKLCIMMSQVCGSYQMAGDRVHIAILEKPFLVGCGTISQTIKEYLSGLG